MKIGGADQKMSHPEFLKLGGAGISASAPLFAAGCLALKMTTTMAKATTTDNGGRRRGRG